mgnify:CR=1 FL=1
MGLVSNIDEINKLLEKGVKTRKFIGYNSWTELIHSLSQDTGNKIVQMATGQVVEIVKYHDKATEEDTAGETNYGLVAVNVKETTFKTGEKVIDGVGEVITLKEDVQGIVISGTSNITKVGDLGTYTPCESGFIYVSKESFVTSVVAICGYGIEDDVAKQLVKDLDALSIDWGPDLLKADEIGTEEDKILCEIKKGGNTYFNSKGQDNVYDGLVQLDFFEESGTNFIPGTIYQGTRATYETVSLSDLLNGTVNNIIDFDEYVNIRKEEYLKTHTSWPASIPLSGWNDKFRSQLNYFIDNNFLGNISESGVGYYSIWTEIDVDVDDYPEYPAFRFTINCNFSICNNDTTTYTETTESNEEGLTWKKGQYSFNNTVNIKNIYFYFGLANNNSTIRIVDYSTSDEQTAINNIHNDMANIETSSGTVMSNSRYRNFYNDDKVDWHNYIFGVTNIGAVKQGEEKYKKRKFPDAKTPDPSKSLEENYPDWDNKKDSTSKPTDSNPNNKEDYRPGKINNNKKDPDNNDNNSQKDSQDGKNTNKDIKDDTDSGKEIIDDINDPEQDPSDPDDDPIGETPDVLIPINPISDSGFVSLYNPSGFELRKLSQYLWSDNFINNIKKLFQDPMDAIIGLHMIFGSPTTGGKTNIKVGFVDTGVTANKITAQYFTIDCGTVNVREYFKDARDYDFCNISIYLPFVGIQKLNSKDLMDASVRVLATVDVVTGALLYEIDVTKKGLKQCLYTFSGNCAVQLPISAGSYSSAIANLIGIGAGIAGTVASGGALAPALISGIGSAAVNSHIDVQTSNSIGSNAGAMGIKKPYLIINRLSSYNANAYQKTQGYPSNKTAKIGSLKGVAKIKECHLEGIPATDEELEEIYTLLKQGVIL